VLQHRHRVSLQWTDELEGKGDSQLRGRKRTPERCIEESERTRRDSELKKRSIRERKKRAVNVIKGDGASIPGPEDAEKKLQRHRSLY